MTRQRPEEIFRFVLEALSEQLKKVTVLNGIITYRNGPIQFQYNFAGTSNQKQLELK